MITEEEALLLTNLSKVRMIEAILRDIAAEKSPAIRTASVLLREWREAMEAEVEQRTKEAARIVQQEGVAGREMPPRVREHAGGGGPQPRTPMKETRR